MPEASLLLKPGTQNYIDYTCFSFKENPSTIMHKLNELANMMDPPRDRYHTRDYIPKCWDKTIKESFVDSNVNFYQVLLLHSC